MSSSDILLRSKYKLGKQLIEAGRYEEARSVYEQICARRKNDADSWFILGTINGMLKRHADAATCCSKAVELSPDHAAAWYNLGIALRDSGQNEAAANALSKTLALNPAMRAQQRVWGISSSHWIVMMKPKRHSAECWITSRGMRSSTPHMDRPCRPWGDTRPLSRSIEWQLSFSPQGLRICIL